MASLAIPIRFTGNKKRNEERALLYFERAQAVVSLYGL